MLLVACGAESSTPTLNWYINPDNGGQGRLAKKCADASNGAYQVTIQTLPNDASSSGSSWSAGWPPRTARST